MTDTSNRTNWLNLEQDESREYQIKASAKAFSALFDDIYSRKEQACLRETFSNALDTHFRAGKPLHPIDIHMPTNDEPWFSVRDYGDGMDDKKVMGLFSTFFDSDKEDDDLEVGMFGLGSKVPFAVSDRFTLDVFIDGTRRMYVNLRGDDGVPSIERGGVVSTNEPDGVLVTVPIDKPAARQEFQRWLPAVALGFPGLLRLPDGEIVKVPKPILSSPDGNWDVYKSSQRPQGIVEHTYVRQGCVLYPVERLNGLGYSYFVIVDVPVNTLAVSPSRETLSFNPMTKRNLAAVMTEAKADIQRQIKVEVEAQSSLAQATRRAYELSPILQQQFNAYTWNGNPLASDLVVPRCGELFGAASSRGNFNQKKEVIAPYTIYGREAKIIIDDGRHVVRSTARIRKLMGRGNLSAAYLYKTTDPTRARRALTLDLCLDDSSILNLWDLEDPGAPTRNGTTATPGVVTPRRGLYIEGTPISTLPTDYLWVPVLDRESWSITLAFSTTKQYTVHSGQVTSLMYALGIRVPLVVASIRGQKACDPKKLASDTLRNLIQLTHPQLADEMKKLMVSKQLYPDIHELLVGTPPVSGGVNHILREILASMFGYTLNGDALVEVYKQQYPLLFPSPSSEAKIGYINTTRFCEAIVSHLGNGSAGKPS